MLRRKSKGCTDKAVEIISEFIKDLKFNIKIPFLISVIYQKRMHKMVQFFKFICFN